MVVGRIAQDKNASDKLFIGNYLDPKDAGAMRREAASVAKGQGKAALDLVPTCQVGHTAERHTRLVQLCPPNLTYPMAVRITNSEADLGKPTVRGSGGFGSTGK